MSENKDLKNSERTDGIVSYSDQSNEKESATVTQVTVHGAKTEKVEPSKTEDSQAETVEIENDKSGVPRQPQKSSESFKSARPILAATTDYGYHRSTGQNQPSQDDQEPAPVPPRSPEPADQESDPQGNQPDPQKQQEIEDAAQHHAQAEAQPHKSAVENEPAKETAAGYSERQIKSRDPLKTSAMVLLAIFIIIILILIFF